MVNNDNDQNSNTPEYDPSKPMDSKKDVSQSPDEKTDQDFPGYPHYPAKEDIMNESTGSHRVDAKVEDMGAAPNTTGVSQRYGATQETDLSPEDNNPLQNRNEEIGVPQNVTKEALENKNDVPGTEIDEAAEKGDLNP